jgi:hypothetical protein
MNRLRMLALEGPWPGPLHREKYTIPDALVPGVARRKRASAK